MLSRSAVRDATHIYDVPNLKETLKMLEKICQCPALDEKQVAMLGDVTQELETLRINEKKQTRIEHFF